MKWTERGGGGPTPTVAAAQGVRPPRPSPLHQGWLPGSSGPRAPGEPANTPACARSIARAASSSSSRLPSSSGSTPSSSNPWQPTSAQLPSASARYPRKPWPDLPQPLRPGACVVLAEASCPDASAGSETSASTCWGFFPLSRGRKWRVEFENSSLFSWVLRCYYFLSLPRGQPALPINC